MNPPARPSSAEPCVHIRLHAALVARPQARTVRLPRAEWEQMQPGAQRLYCRDLVDGFVAEHMPGDYAVLDDPEHARSGTEHDRRGLAAALQRAHAALQQAGEHVAALATEDASFAAVAEHLDTAGHALHAATEATDEAGQA